MPRPNWHSVTALPAHARILDESFRQLRVNLASISDAPLGTGGRIVGPAIHPGANILAITSSLPEEGRTLTALRLAIGFAHAGWEVLLVDGDLRRPQIADCFSLPNSRRPGRGSRPQHDFHRGGALQGAAEVVRADQRHSVRRCDELVRAGDVASFVASVRRDFQLIVIDTPALLAAADGSVLAARRMPPCTWSGTAGPPCRPSPEGWPCWTRSAPGWSAAC